MLAAMAHKLRASINWRCASSEFAHRHDHRALAQANFNTMGGPPNCRTCTTHDVGSVPTCGIGLYFTRVNPARDVSAIKNNHKRTTRAFVCYWLHVLVRLRTSILSFAPRGHSRRGSNRRGCPRQGKVQNTQDSFARCAPMKPAKLTQHCTCCAITSKRRCEWFFFWGFLGLGHCKLAKVFCAAATKASLVVCCDGLGTCKTCKTCKLGLRRPWRAC